jgi:hypothetical protein
LYGVCASSSEEGVVASVSDVAAECRWAASEVVVDKEDEKGLRLK